MTAVMTPNWWDATTQEFVDDLAILLVRFDHHQLAEPLRVASCDIDIVSDADGQGSQTWAGWPMGIKLPSKGDEQPRGSVRFGNVDHRIGRTILNLKGEVKVSFFVVSQADFNDLVYTHENLKLASIRSDKGWVTAELHGQGAHGLSFPTSSATPDTVPGVFVA